MPAADGAERYARLQDVVEDDLFPEVDLALRRGEHVDVSDPDRYAFLKDVQRHLEAFYLRYGCQLVQADGYFFLLPQGDRLGRRHLSAGEMLVGQALALMLLDPATLRTQGVVPRQQVTARLAQLVGEERLVEALNPRRRRRDRRVAEQTARRELDKALRSLAALGFVEVLSDDDLRLRRPLLRFTETVRGADDPSAALERLVREGRLTLDVGRPADDGDRSAGTDEADPADADRGDVDPGDGDDADDPGADAEEEGA
ncbi:MAG: chromosome partition protein MukE [Planctomycetota bacterium]|nr:chromosome partition protein MukE [Planctomycetota bacterium]